jgi:hypothetical protein
MNTVDMDKNGKLVVTPITAEEILRGIRRPS